jgi:hypothetical protein
MICKACHAEHSPLLRCDVARRLRESSAARAGLAALSVHDSGSNPGKSGTGPTVADKRRAPAKPGHSPGVKAHPARPGKGKTGKRRAPPLTAARLDIGPGQAPPLASSTPPPRPADWVKADKPRPLDRQRKYRQAHADDIRARDRERKRLVRAAAKVEAAAHATRLATRRAAMARKSVKVGGTGDI